MEAALDRSDDLNREKELLDMETVDWSTGINEGKELLGPHQRLWDGVKDYLDKKRVWYSEPLLKNNSEEADKDAEGCKGAAARSERELPEEAEKPKAVAALIKKEAQSFIRDHLPVLTLLANPGLRERHWDEMASTVGKPLPHNDRSTLQDMLRLELDKSVNDIEETCVNASKEYSLEKAMDRMQEEWAPLQIELKAHKDTGTYILTGSSADEVQALLDDHIVKA